MGIKITPADSAFSKCIRTRDHYTCQRCSTSYTPSDTGLHCSHFHGRGNWSVRLDPENAESHCYGCHQYFEANPHEFSSYWLEKMGQGAYDLLLERKLDIDLSKMYRKTKGKGDIAKHFRGELESMEYGDSFERFY